MAGTGKELPTPAALKAAARRELLSLGDLLGATEPGQSVHGARRRIKQLRSLLRLLRGPLSQDAATAINGALRNAAEALAGERRAEALVTASGKLEGDGKGDRYWLKLAQAHRSAHAAERTAGEGLARARDAVAEASSLLAATRLSRKPEHLVENTLVHTYARARKRLHKALRSGDPEELHEARKLVIHHLHHLALLQADDGRRLQDLEALREALGDLNDLDELEQLARNLEPHPTGGPASRMKRARARLIALAGERSEKLFHLKPKAWSKANLNRA